MWKTTQEKVWKAVSSSYIEYVISYILIISYNLVNKKKKKVKKKRKLEEYRI